MTTHSTRSRPTGRTSGAPRQGRRRYHRGHLAAWFVLGAALPGAGVLAWLALHHPAVMIVLGVVSMVAAVVFPVMEALTKD